MLITGDCKQGKQVLLMQFFPLPSRLEFFKRKRKKSFKGIT